MQIVLSNSYGTPNVGDEAILTVLVRELQDSGHDVSILTFYPRTTARRHPRATVIRSGVIRGAWSTWNAIRRADLLIIGGGGIIQDATSLGNLLFHLSRAWMARLSGTPYAICGAGIGPLHGALSRRLTKAACTHARKVIVRDAHSAQLLASIGVPAARVETGADLAWCLETCGEEKETGRRNDGGPVIGLSMRPPVGNARERARQTALREHIIREGALLADRLVESRDARIVFVSMNPEQDDAIAQALAETMRHRDRFTAISGELPPGKIKAAIGGLDLLVGTRLHSIIFAASQSVPVVAFAYDDKVRACMETLGLGDQVLGPEQWDAGAIATRAGAALDDRERLRATCDSAVPALVTSARETISACVRCVGP